MLQFEHHEAGQHQEGCEEWELVDWLKLAVIHCAQDQYSAKWNLQLAKLAKDDVNFCQLLC